MGRQETGTTYLRLCAGHASKDGVLVRHYHWYWKFISRFRQLDEAEVLVRFEIGMFGDASEGMLHDIRLPVQGFLHPCLTVDHGSSRAYVELCDTLRGTLCVQISMIGWMQCEARSITSTTIFLKVPFLETLEL